MIKTTTATSYSAEAIHHYTTMMLIHT